MKLLHVSVLDVFCLCLPVCPPRAHHLGVTYTVYLWFVGKLVVNFLLVLIELFCQLSRLRRYEQILVEILVFEMGLCHFERKFQWEGGRPPATRVPGLSRGVVCVILSVAVLIQNRRVTDTHTDCVCVCHTPHRQTVAYGFCAYDSDSRAWDVPSVVWISEVVRHPVLLVRNRSVRRRSQCSPAKRVP